MPLIKPKLLSAMDVINISIGHTVYTDIPAHFAYQNKRGDFKTIVHEAVTIEGTLEYLAGKYVVVNTSSNGGSGPSSVGHTLNDYRSDGHHVFCEKLSDGTKIDFYQTGSFTAMIENIGPIGMARMRRASTWVVEPIEIDFL